MASTKKQTTKKILFITRVTITSSVNDDRFLCSKSLKEIQDRKIIQKYRNKKGKKEKFFYFFLILDILPNNTLQCYSMSFFLIFGYVDSSTPAHAKL